MVLLSHNSGATSLNSRKKMPSMPLSSAINFVFVISPWKHLHEFISLAACTRQTRLFLGVVGWTMFRKIGILEPFPHNSLRIQRRENLLIIMQANSVQLAFFSINVCARLYFHSHKEATRYLKTLTGVPVGIVDRSSVRPIPLLEILNRTPQSNPRPRPSCAGWGCEIRW